MSRETADERRPSRMLFLGKIGAAGEEIGNQGHPPGRVRTFSTVVLHAVYSYLNCVSFSWSSVDVRLLERIRNRRISLGTFI